MQSRRSRARPLRSRTLRVRRGEMPASIRQIRFSPQARTRRTEQLPEEPLARMRRAATGFCLASSMMALCALSDRGRNESIVLELIPLGKGRQGSVATAEAEEPGRHHARDLDV